MSDPRVFKSAPHVPVLDADAELDAFLREQGGLDGLQVFAEALPAAAPPGALHARVLASAERGGRLARFAQQASELLDLPEPEAARLLDRLDDAAAWEPGFLPGMRLCHVRGGDKVAHAITGFVHLRAGDNFPEHQHFGEEQVLVLQGRCVDRGHVCGPGDIVHMPAGSSHTFTVCEGPDLLYLAVVQGGLRVGDQVLSADDPRA